MSTLLDDWPLPGLAYCGTLSVSGDAWALVYAYRVLAEERREAEHQCGRQSIYGVTWIALHETLVELASEVPRGN